MIGSAPAAVALVRASTCDRFERRDEKPELRRSHRSEASRSRPRAAPPRAAAADREHNDGRPRAAAILNHGEHVGGAPAVRFAPRVRSERRDERARRAGTDRSRERRRAAVSAAAVDAALRRVREERRRHDDDGAENISPPASLLDAVDYARLLH